MKKIVLGSTSPRRKEIFAKTFLPFEVKDSKYEEEMSLQMEPRKLAEFLSLGKAKALVSSSPDSIIITADTFIIFEDRVIGKPHTEEKAREILKSFRNCVVEVVTGVTIIDTGENKEVSFSDTTKIFFDNFSDEKLEQYLATLEPMDKAGAFALQELGALLINKIDGDFFNAMGLPLKRISEELEKFDIDILKYNKKNL